MELLAGCGICILALVSLCEGGSLSTLKEPSRCGDWTPYKDEKCFMIARKAGHQTQADAEIVCESYSEELHRESYPKLVTIKTKEEQEFLQNFLFVENKMENNVWLGLKEIGSTGKFEWNDGSEVIFNNWLNQSLSDDKHHCVEMESGGKVHAMGLWSKVKCEQENVVVCERTQTWTLETLQKAFFKYRFDKELEKENLEKKLELMTRADEAAKQEINNLKQGSQVPIGFIYIQLPHQDSPTILWPAAKWTEVSSNYSGLFFRVTGGNAAMFEQIQESSSPRLKDVERKLGANGADGRPIPPDGTWSEFVYSGGSSSTYNGMRFRMSTEEVRPRNKAVKIWQRIDNEQASQVLKKRNIP